MKALVVLIFVTFFIEDGIGQSFLQPYFGAAFATLEGHDTEPIPGRLIVNSNNEVSKGILIGLTYTHQISNKSSIGIDVSSNSYQTESYISRVQDYPERIGFREFSISPIYKYEIVKERIQLFTGPQVSMLTNHREFNYNLDGTVDKYKIQGLDNFMFGVQSGMLIKYKSVWIGGDISVPISLRDSRSYRQYIKKYSSFSVKFGYEFEL